MFASTVVAVALHLVVAADGFVTSPAFPAGDIGVTEKTGAQLPLDLTFVTASGEHRTLGALLAGELPTIVTFNYSRCETLCSVQLGTLVAAFGQLDWRVGQQFRVLTIDFDPADDVSRLAQMRNKYVTQLPTDSVADAWQFVAAQPGAPAGPSAVTQLAESLGFRYRYIENVREWAHPAALMFISSSGRVVRYIHGLDYNVPDLKESIYHAGVNEPTTAKGFQLRCFHWDPATLDKSWFGVLALRIGAALAVLTLIGFGIWAYWRGRAQRRVNYAAS